MSFFLKYQYSFPLKADNYKKELYNNRQFKVFKLRIHIYYLKIINQYHKYKFKLILFFKKFNGY